MLMSRSCGESEQAAQVAYFLQVSPPSALKRRTSHGQEIVDDRLGEIGQRPAHLRGVEVLKLGLELGAACEGAT